MSFMCKFKGITQQIDHQLLQSNGITQKKGFLRDQSIPIDLSKQFQPLVIDSVLKHLQYFINN